MKNENILYANSIGKRLAVYHTPIKTTWSKGEEWKNCLPGGLTEQMLKMQGWKLIGYCILRKLK